jgi:hypothetical protein
MKDITTVSSGSITNTAALQATSQSKKNFCTKFNPVVNEEGLADTTVIENTYMYYTLPAYCDDQTEALTYTIFKSTGSAVDSWMIWDGTTRTL